MKVITISKNSFFFWLLLITTSANFCANGKGWLSSIRTYFSSFQMPHSFATFKRPTFNQKWLGVGALAIASASYAAWKYFKNKRSRKNSPTDINDPELIKIEKEFKELENSSNGKATWTDIEDANIVYSKNKKTENFAIDDIVKISNDESLYYARETQPLILEKQFENHRQYLNNIAIIRSIDNNSITIEARGFERKENSKKLISANFSLYFVIPSKNITKMELKKLKMLKKNTLVRTKLPIEKVKGALAISSPTDSASARSLLGIVQKDQEKESKTVSVKCFFHHRQFITGLNFDIDEDKIEAVYDPNTNMAIMIE